MLFVSEIEFGSTVTFRWQAKLDKTPIDKGDTQSSFVTLPERWLWRCRWLWLWIRVRVRFQFRVWDNALHSSNNSSSS